MMEQTVSIERMEDAIDIFGSFDENIRLIEQELGVRVVGRDDQLKISGEDTPVAYAAKVIQGLIGLSARGESIHEQNVRYLIHLVKSGNEDKIQTLAADVLCVTAKGKPVKVKTVGQKKYVDAIRANTVTLGVGPAGTGKTYLAVAAAVVMNGLPRGGSRPGGKLLLPLLLTLLFNGCSDSMSKIFAYAGRREEDGLFVFFIFFFAGLFTLAPLVRGGKGLTRRDLLLGALVGVPNFCASRLLLAALTRLPAFVVYPCYSVGAILVISLCSVLLFHERLSRRQWGAVGMILAAVALLNL